MAFHLTKSMPEFSPQHFDRSHLWHPYASLPPQYDNILITHAKGVYLYTDDGKRLIDGMSSWWAVIHGYNHPTLNQAVSEQLSSMAHVMFGGLTHTPAINLGELLLNLANTQLKPDHFTGCFYADSGSVAVEVALKTALQYQLSQPTTQKRHFATTRSGYHGDTWHAMSVCDPVTGMHSLYGAQLPMQYFIPKPPLGFDKPMTDDYRQTLDEFFATHHDKLAGFIIEPIAQGAGGMRFYSPDILNYISQLCQTYDILLIADEIATGFGRTGKMFACQWADVCPDILILGKGLTGGYMSFGAVLSSSQVAQTIKQSDNPALMHGPTFMGNPLACAVAYASVKLCIENDTPKQALHIEQILKNHFNDLQKNPHVRDVRCLGAIGVIEMAQTVDMVRWQSLVSEFGIWVRPFGKLIYIMPPYVISDDELITLCQNLKALINTYLESKS